MDPVDWVISRLWELSVLERQHISFFSLPSSVSSPSPSHKLRLPCLNASQQGWSKWERRLKRRRAEPDHLGSILALVHSAHGRCLLASSISHGGSGVGCSEVPPCNQGPPNWGCLTSSAICLRILSWPQTTHRPGKTWILCPCSFCCFGSLFKKKSTLYEYKIRYRPWKGPMQWVGMKVHGSTVSSPLVLNLCIILLMPLKTPGPATPKLQGAHGETLYIVHSLGFWRGRVRNPQPIDYFQGSFHHQPLPPSA